MNPNPSPAVRLEIPPDILPSYEAYGCKLNALAPEELFRRYEQAGFIYPAKMQRLKPLLPQILSNWTRAMQGEKPMLCCLTYEDKNSGDWATVTAWGSTKACWNVQHLASIGGPVGSRAVMLAVRETFLNEGRVKANQVWFRPANKYSNRVFGSVVESFTPEHASANSYQYIGLPFPMCRNGNEAIRVREAELADMPAVCDLAGRVRGKVYMTAEELEREDFRLSEVDDMYRKVGLRRYRRIWVAERRGASVPAAAAVVYRGPLGLNFSFLENRCDMLVAPEVTDENLRELLTTLLANVVGAYEDFSLGLVPVTTDDRAAKVLLTSGAELFAQYAQSIWLEEAISAWNLHVNKFYERIIRANKRHGLGSKHIHNSEPDKTNQPNKEQL
jgi:hypothetical protein